MFLLLFIVFANAYDVSLLNEFSGDVDIYDMGTMGRGKNAASWHYSLTKKQNVFYYLAMQPWRHLEWTDCTGSTCYKFIINEDASFLPAADGSTYLPLNSTNDYCRKEYAHPMATFDIDWEQIDPESRLDSLDINGIVCYRHPAKAPLVNIYLQQQYNKKEEVAAMTPCRYDFIGGKSITFRSFNDLSKTFFTNDKADGYLVNKTRCSVAVTPNNVNTDLAIVLGISDTTVKYDLYTALQKLENVANLKKATIYYLSGESIRKEEIKNWENLGLKQISAGAVDAVINAAKNDLAQRVKSKAIYRGTMVVLMDRALQTTFDAETAFDRNNITVHNIIFNPRGEHLIVKRATSLLSVGYHQYEFKDNAGISKVMDSLFVGIRANLTERCSRMSCNGFCDGRDRCTCPMCCENTCYFSYCNTTTATCMPWPEAKPKRKMECTENPCVGKQECFDLQGCVYTEYNPGCKPAAKCMKTICDKNGVCQPQDACERDLRPSKDNRCWRYKCNEETGNCERTNEAGEPCEYTTDMCVEFVCDDDLVCSKQPKNCVKTSPFAEMDCYKAQCNRNTGKCEHVLDCPNTKLDSLRACGKTVSESLCKCTSPDFKCSCVNPDDKDGFCEEGYICDTTTGEQICRQSKCGQDLYVDGCQIKTCNENNGHIEWVDKDCSQLITLNIGHDKDTDEKNYEIANKYCKDKFEIYCEGDGVCGARGRMMPIEENEEFYLAACGKCTMELVSEDKQTGKQEYSIKYGENLGEFVPKCPDGSKSTAYETFKDELKAQCQQINNEWTVVFGQLEKDVDVQSYCAGCYEDLECHLASEYMKYTYDYVTGTCTHIQLKTPPQCHDCDTSTNDVYKPTCLDKKFDKTFDFERSGNAKTIEYEIDKLCINNQCIPNPDFDCNEAIDKDGNKVVDVLGECGEVTSEYHFSSFFSQELRARGMVQSQAFLDEAEAMAYCTWDVKTSGCYRCDVDASQNLVKADECVELKENYQPADHRDFITVECIDEECVVKYNLGECPAKDCYLYEHVTKLPSGSTCIPGDDDSCCKSSVYTCAGVLEELEGRKQKYVKAHPNEKELICDSKEVCSSDGFSCSSDMNSDVCVAAYNRYVAGKEDFGCRIPNLDCDFDTLHCTYTPMTKPEEDTRFFLNRDEVVFGNLCYNYTCVEEVVDGKLEHHWRLTPESLIEQNKQPESVCEIAACNPLTGKSETKVRDCLVSEHFKQISEAQAECFYCQCSYLNGEMVLVMMPEGKGKTYELDACGNCIVRDQKTGQQINDPVECVLDAPVNLTGAIAGATVAASVVFGLIGSMVVVSIGAFQTYQLVSSAMKNVISTTLENPEFVAADNEATNVLNNE